MALVSFQPWSDELCTCRWPVTRISLASSRWASRLTRPRLPCDRVMATWKTLSTTCLGEVMIGGETIAEMIEAVIGGMIGEMTIVMTGGTLAVVEAEVVVAEDVDEEIET